MGTRSTPPPPLTAHHAQMITRATAPPPMERSPSTSMFALSPHFLPLSSPLSPSSLSSLPFSFHFCLLLSLFHSPFHLFISFHFHLSVRNVSQRCSLTKHRQHMPDTSSTKMALSRRLDLKGTLSGRTQKKKPSKSTPSRAHRSPKGGSKQRRREAGNLITSICRQKRHRSFPLPLSYVPPFCFLSCALPCVPLRVRLCHVDRIEPLCIVRLAIACGKPP